MTVKILPEPTLPREAWTAEFEERESEAYARWSPKCSDIVLPEQDEADVAQLKVKELASRGFTLGALLELLCLLLERIQMPDFDPDESTTIDIAKQFVIPRSKTLGTAYARIMTGGAECYPQRMVTHTWSNKFCHSVAACVAEALGVAYFFHIIPRLRTIERVRALIEELKNKKGKLLDLSFWFCALSVNQHAVGCTRCGCDCNHPKYQDGDYCEVNKFDDMMKYLKQVHSDFTQVVAMDKNLVALNRVWVVAEIAQAQRDHLNQHMKVHFPIRLSNWFLRLRVWRIDVRHCQASEPSDRDMILAKIDDKDAYNKIVRAILLRSFDLKQHIIEKVFLVFFWLGSLSYLLWITFLIARAASPWDSGCPSRTDSRRDLPYFRFRCGHDLADPAMAACFSVGMCVLNLLFLPAAWKKRYGFLMSTIEQSDPSTRQEVLSELARPQPPIYPRCVLAVAVQDPTKFARWCFALALSTGSLGLCALAAFFFSNDDPDTGEPQTVAGTIMSVQACLLNVWSAYTLRSDFRKWMKS